MAFNDISNDFWTDIYNDISNAMWRTICNILSIITACIRKMAQGNVFSLSTPGGGGGGVPQLGSQSFSQTPSPRSFPEWGVPQSLVPYPFWWDTPS